jgi:hypothetical protein
LEAASEVGVSVKPCSSVICHIETAQKLKPGRNSSWIEENCLKLGQVEPSDKFIVPVAVQHIHLLAGIGRLAEGETLLLASPTVEASDQARGNHTITCTKLNNVTNQVL